MATQVEFWGGPHTWFQREWAVLSVTSALLDNSAIYGEQCSPGSVLSFLKSKCWWPWGHQFILASYDWRPSPGREVHKSSFLCLSLLIYKSKGVDKGLFSKLCNLLYNPVYLFLFVSGHTHSHIPDFSPAWWQRVSQPRSIWSRPLPRWKWQL